MAFKCNECNLTYPNRKDQVDELGEPGICSDCYDEEEHASSQKTAATAASDDSDDDDDNHPWGHYPQGPA